MRLILKLFVKTRFRLALCASLCSLWAAASVYAQDPNFSYNSPGQLAAGSGQGRVDLTVYVPDMRFPIEASPAFANSQVWGVGGLYGPSGSECHVDNYSYPWADNYCESRSWDMPLCPSATGHQGQDIRASTCDADLHWAVAAEEGTITGIGSYTVSLTADNGTRHRYLHMEPSSLTVSVGQRVTKGQRMGRVSDAFGDSSTTTHLHYDLYQNISGVGGVFVPTYMSLVRSYEELLNVPATPCILLGPEGGQLDDSGPCFQQFGPPASWRYVEGKGQENTLRWTYTWTSDSPGNWARWEIFLAEGGDYTVEASVHPDHAQSQATPYAISHSGQITELVVNQSGSSAWMTLGTFSFAAGGPQWIAVYDNSGESLDAKRALTADAVRITRLRPNPSDTSSSGADDVASPVDTLSPSDIPAVEDTHALVDLGTTADAVAPFDVTFQADTPSGKDLDANIVADTATLREQPKPEILTADSCSCASLRVQGKDRSGWGALMCGLFVLAFFLAGKQTTRHNNRNR